VIGTNSNHDLDIKTNASTRIRIEDAGNVIIGATSMGDTDSKVGINGKLRVGDIANTQDGLARAYLHVDSGAEDPGATSGDFVRLSTLMMDGGADGNNVMYSTYALRNETASSPNRTWTSLSIVDGVRVDTTAEVLKADGVTGNLIRMWHEIDINAQKRHWGHNDEIGMTYHHTSGGRLGIGTTAPEAKLEIEQTDGAVHGLKVYRNDSSTSTPLVFMHDDSIYVDNPTLHVKNDRTDEFGYAAVFEGRVGIGTTSPASELHVVGHIQATTKSFDIEHPTEEGKRLHHGSLEGPEHGVYVRGALETEDSTEGFIELPDYWLGLVDEDTITVQLTGKGRFQRLYVAKIEDNRVYVENEKMHDINCYYFIQAERKDVEKMVVEY
jgi:hypothetical protein